MWVLVDIAVVVKMLEDAAAGRLIASKQIHG